MPDPMEKVASAADGVVDPGEIARIQASVRGLEQAPSSRQQLGAFANWEQLRDQLGLPFNNERVPLNKLKLMRRDPMIGFGLHFTKTPIIRAPWYIKSPDPQVAAFIDGALRPIMGSLMIQILQKFEFGFQAIAKRFTFGIPEATYIDPETGEEVPAWPNSSGGEPPVILKPFVTLAPETVTPMFDDKSGEFNGINFKPSAGGGVPAGTGAKKSGKGGSEGQVEIDLYHSLWVTNEKDSVNGNIFGYPRLGYVYPYWWSYWFRWAIADRAFERKGDPPTIVRHPEGSITLSNGEQVSNAEYALLMADRLRAGSGIALPSTPYVGFDDRPSQIREWDIEFLKGGIELDPFDKSFNYLDVMKLRGIFVPEQSLIEGEGGTSSRNVAKEMYQGLVESQSEEMGLILETVNRYIIPTLLVVNFPEKVAQGITAKMATRGFSAQDMELLNQIVQLVGQQDAELLGVDIREALRSMNLPLLPEQEYQKRLKEKAAQAALEGPGAVAPAEGRSGVVPTRGKAPATQSNSTGAAEGSFTGFTYVDSIDRINLSDVAGEEFVSSLPPSMHFQDKAVRAMTKQLYNAMRQLYKSQYGEFADWLDNLDEPVQLTLEEDDDEAVELAVPEIMQEVGRRIVSRWPSSTEKIDEAIRKTTQIIKAIVKRAESTTRKKSNLAVELSDDDAQFWTDARVADVIAKAFRTTRNELIDFVANFANEGESDPKDLAGRVREHFADFPDWKAARYARTETRDAVNAGILLSGQSNGLVAAQAVDARYGPTDDDCEFRDGRIYSIQQALNEEEHPNGTLGWRLLREPVSISRVVTLPSGANFLAEYDPEENVVYFTDEIEPLQESEFMLAVGEGLSA